MVLVAWLMVVLVLAGVVERAWHMRNVARIKTRVLVNGTRGKTSVTRLLAAAMNEGGCRTLAKCTGTQAATIDPDGAETALTRRRGARLTEQLPLFARAARMDASAIVIECMAVRPESQQVMAELTRPTLVLVTNARVDHVGEIGASERETLDVLALSIPQGAQVVSGEAGLAQYGHRPIAPDDQPLPDGYMDSFRYPAFEENIRLVLAACAALGIDRGAALRGMRKAQPDIGMAGPFTVGDATVINAFAANDVQSTESLLRQVERSRGLSDAELTIVFNNRADREYRLRAFLPLIRSLGARVTRLIAIGDHPAKVARYYARSAGVEAAAGDPAALLASGGIVLCIGNIKGAGVSFIEACQRAEEAELCNRQP